MGMQAMDTVAHNGGVAVAKAHGTQGADFVGVIAIDGPSGSGKSTVARQLALRLGVAYLDTGAMYRAATWAVLQTGIDPEDVTGVAEVVAESELEIDIYPAAARCRIDGIDVTRVIRGSEVTAAVSAVAANSQVRRQLVTQQQGIIATAMRGVAMMHGRTRSERQVSKRGIVVEGRDIASTVAPEAILKVYLTASHAARARRRQRDSAAPTDAQLAQVAHELQQRDALDSARAMDPLRIVPEAVVLDTTDLAIDNVVAKLVELHTAAAAARES